ASVRRLHDTGRSGKWALAAVIPGALAVLWIPLAMVLPLLLPVFLVLFAAGFVLLIVLLTRPGDKGKNDYGPAPRG
ncbi:MAG: DUF805 domain-containing protein, partial [Abditibacteriota bacterium]|nr:DUF805 domain-containing protein [Abditibacteriota bacterium]